MVRNGTGETGLTSPLSHEAYRKDCDPAFVVDWYCTMYSVTPPTLHRNPTPAGATHCNGHYHIKTKMIGYNRDWAGLVLHELAHHIVNELHLNGVGEHHGYHFSRILQEMIDQWS